MIVVLILFSAVAALLYYFHRFRSGKDKFWIDQGVHFVKRGDVVPLSNLFTQKVSMTEFDEKIYKKAGDVPYFGYVELGLPAFYIKDLDLIKQITIKDFDHFVDRRVMEFSKNEAVFGRMLTNTSGKEWKELRSMMSPTFSTGKIKRMFELFNRCGDGLTKFLKEKRKETDVYDFQEAFGRFTLSAIAAIAFGQPTDAFEDDSTFRKMAKKINTFSAYRVFKFIMNATFPKVVRALGLSILEPESTAFFSSIIEHNIKQRRAEGESVKRNDFLQLLLEAQSGKLNKTEESELNIYEKDALLKDEPKNLEGKTSAVLDDVTILAQSVLFFVAGSDTLESALTMAVYELALNPEVQEKLAKEVHEALKNNNGELSYDVLNSMEYLDMVVSESMRLHPPAFATERHCTKDYIVPGTKIRLPKNTRVVVPIRQIHHNAKYYPNPMKFDPENFSQENKAKRHPYAYLPFGLGPRNCIAMRFAIVEAKAALAHLVNSVKVEPCEKTPIPIEISSKSGILKPKNGMPLKFNIRRW